MYTKQFFIVQACIPNTFYCLQGVLESKMVYWNFDCMNFECLYCKSIYLGAQNVCYRQGVLECKMLNLMASVNSASHAKIAGTCILSVVVT